ncbi:MAG: ferrous iron transport protein A [Saprospiraceae bacterium]|nr:ferrous iron transport protein A [Saprospiraceae bacterium]
MSMTTTPTQYMNLGNEISLVNLKENEEGNILYFTDERTASKLIAMGVLPGKTLKLVRRVPFGGGLYVKIEEQNIGLREDEARHIYIKRTIF